MWTHQDIDGEKEHQWVLGKKQLGRIRFVLWKNFKNNIYFTCIFQFTCVQDKNAHIDFYQLRLNQKLFGRET